MIYTPIVEHHSNRLILIFAGWGTDARFYSGLKGIDGYDIAVMHDYETLQITQEEELKLADYSEIVVVAWSYGVASASLFMNEHPSLPYTLRIAVNGTPWAVDDDCGIPRAIFRGTLDTLCEASLRKFQRRMAGGAAAMKAIEALLPDTDIEVLKRQLTNIGNRPAPLHPATLWDLAVIADNDAIIPTANQLNAWQKLIPTELANGPHLPDLQQIIESHITDKRLVAQCFDRSANTYCQHARVQRRMARQLADRLLSEAPAQIDRMIEVGAGTGLFTECYASRLTPRRLELWDLIKLNPSLPGIHSRCDAETAILSQPDGSADVIASAATVQWMNSPIAFARESLRILRPGGILALSTFGERNFEELNPFTNRPAYPSAEQWRHALAAEGRVIDIIESIEKMTFSSPRELLLHMRLTGVNASSGGATRAAMAIMKSGVTTLTYHPIIITVKRLS